MPSLGLSEWRNLRPGRCRCPGLVVTMASARGTSVMADVNKSLSRRHELHFYHDNHPYCHQRYRGLYTFYRPSNYVLCMPATLRIPLICPPPYRPLDHTHDTSSSAIPPTRILAISCSDYMRQTAWPLLRLPLLACMVLMHW